MTDLTKDDLIKDDLFENPPTLKYLDIKGFAEPIRLAFALGKVNFIDDRITYDQIKEMRSNNKLPFSQVPILILSNNMIISQSNAILRFVGNRVGLIPNNEYIKLYVDIYLEAFADINKNFVPIWYEHAVGRSPLTGELYEDTKLTQNQIKAVLNALNLEILPKRFDLIEQSYLNSFPLLGTNISNFLCGEILTIADLVLYTLVTGIQDNNYCPGISISVIPPNLLRIVENVGNLEAIVSWNNNHK
jgi:glutathione S-transferase